MSVFEDRFRKRTIEHVTLPEGASRAAARSQIDTDTLERIREDVLPALATGVAVAVPGNPDYRLRPVAASEGALAVRLESVAGAELMSPAAGARPRQGSLTKLPTTPICTTRCSCSADSATAST